MNSQKERVLGTFKKQNLPKINQLFAKSTYKMEKKKKSLKRGGEILKDTILIFKSHFLVKSPNMYKEIFCNYLKILKKIHAFFI